ncbi:MAG: hypothetical protein M0R37_12760 [Bacteroidales bacterium]|nr:hypothetical protein [Bacteroidales bacterium]
MTTAVATWATAFHAAGFKWLSTMPVDQVFSDMPGPDGDFYCRLCEDYHVPSVDRKAHAANHLTEYRFWKRDREREARLAQQNALKTYRREKRLEKTVLG